MATASVLSCAGRAYGKLFNLFSFLLMAIDYPRSLVDRGGHGGDEIIYPRGWESDAIVNARSRWIRPRLASQSWRVPPAGLPRRAKRKPLAFTPGSRPRWCPPACPARRVVNSSSLWW
jgi:hypothetical protein